MLPSLPPSRAPVFRHDEEVLSSFLKGRGPRAPSFTVTAVMSNPDQALDHPLGSASKYSQQGVINTMDEVRLASMH